MTTTGSDPRSDYSDAELRARRARARANELRERRDELARGLPATPESVERARRRVEEALARARKRS